MSKYKYFQYNPDTGYLKCLFNPEINKPIINVRNFDGCIISKCKNVWLIEFKKCFNSIDYSMFYQFDNEVIVREAKAELDEILIGVEKA